MVIVKLIGGLGNQLFQYAAARKLANKHSTELKLDVSGFETYKLHKYSLSHFNIQENFASEGEINALTGQRKEGTITRIFRRALHKPAKLPATHIKEKNPFHFDPEILNLPDGVYLEGYWQSEKYFSDIESIVRKELTVKTPLSGKDKELAKQMDSCDSVSIHIRRGDYVTNPHTSMVHGTSDLDYYNRCIRSIAESVKNPHFFVFSDDPEWVRDNLNPPYPTTFVDHNGADRNHEDLRLMSQCKHNIIANSTFSWWGAWLNSNPEKVVLAPKLWFRSDKYNNKDLIPDRWIKI